MDFKNSQAMETYILNNPTFSGWVKTAIESLNERDIVDALQDISMLKTLYTKKWVEVKKQFSSLESVK